MADEERERQRRVRDTLDAQKEELAERKRKEMREAQGFAEQEQVRFCVHVCIIVCVCEFDVRVLRSMSCSG